MEMNLQKSQKLAASFLPNFAGRKGAVRRLPGISAASFEAIKRDLVGAYHAAFGVLVLACSGLISGFSSATAYNHYVQISDLVGGTTVFPAGAACGSGGGLASSTLLYVDPSKISAVANACDIQAAGQFGVSTGVSFSGSSYSEVTYSGMFSGNSFSFELGTILLGVQGNIHATDGESASSAVTAHLMIDGDIIFSLSADIELQSDGIGVQTSDTSNYGPITSSFTTVFGKHFAQMEFAPTAFLLNGLVDGVHTMSFSLMSSSMSTFSNNVQCYGPDGLGGQLEANCSAYATVFAPGEPIGGGDSAVPIPAVGLLLLAGCLGLARERQRG